MRIGIDIDGCLYPWTQAVNQACVARFGVEDPGEHQYWDYLKEKLTPKQWEWVWTSEAAAPVFGRLDMIFEGAQEAVNHLAIDHHVHFVTHRSPYRTAGVTGVWLAKYFRNYRGVHVLDNSTRKHEVMGWDLFVDDKPEVVDELLVAGVRVFMPNRDWNLSYEPQIRDKHRFHRFDDWKEVTTWVDRALTTTR